MGPATNDVRSQELPIKGDHRRADLLKLITAEILGVEHGALEAEASREPAGWEGQGRRVERSLSMEEFQKGIEDSNVFTY